jgi:hypothetical protein
MHRSRVPHLAPNVTKGAVTTRNGSPTTPVPAPPTAVGGTFPRRTAPLLPLNQIQNPRSKRICGGRLTFESQYAGWGLLHSFTGEDPLFDVEAREAGGQ